MLWMYDASSCMKHVNQTNELLRNNNLIMLTWPTFLFLILKVGSLHFILLKHNPAWVHSSIATFADVLQENIFLLMS